MKDAGSFRDPSGFIFYQNDQVFRSVNYNYKTNFDHLIDSGLYEELVNENLLIDHHELIDQKKEANQYKILRVTKIPFISYPYEWSFNQFKDAILLTLEIQKKSIKYGMTLKDATPFNIQFKDNKPVFIDTLSFELIENNNFVWKPYKQFCEMFLGPLCLMKYVDPNLNKLLINHINGIPIDLVVKLLPFRSKFNFTVLIHLIIHNLIKGKKGADSKKDKKNMIISKSKHLNIINQLESFVSEIDPPLIKTEWGEYNEETLSEKKGYVVDKQNTLKSFLENNKYKLCWDIGSNDGFFSRIIGEKYSENVISFDIDWNCVDENYLNCKSSGIKNVFPLILDLSNPSPSIGWLNKERASVYERFGSPDLISCFAIMHHIINAGIPLENFIEFLSKSSKDVLIEYVPMSDPKCQIIFESRGNDFNYPSLEFFKEALLNRFEIINSHKLDETDRMLFHLNKNG